MKVLACLALALCTSCVSSRSQALGTVHFDPRPEEYPIATFDTVEDLPYDFVKVGLVAVTGAPTSSWSAVQRALEEEARELGGDALVLREQGTSPHATFTVGSASNGWASAATLGREKKRMGALVVRFVQPLGPGAAPRD